MTRRKWHSPQLSRQVVSRLYYQAKLQRIPMTVLANRIIERVLGPNEPSDIPVAKENTPKQVQNSKPH
jgi:hypothetical protein